VAARCAGGPGSLVKAFTFDDAITRRAAQSQAAADAGPKRVASARTISAGHAFVQNLRRDHYPITVELPWQDRVRVVFGELASSPWPTPANCWPSGARTASGQRDSAFRSLSRSK
jgi:hypothetical protein